MPERIIRPGILSSEVVNDLSWPEEIFYRRLMSVVDDYGRFDGRDSILRANLYPLRLDHVSESDVRKWKAGCANAGVVRLYSVDSKPFIEVLKFDQRMRGKPRWPEPIGGDSPSDVSESRRPAATRGEIPLSSETYSETETETRASRVRAPRFSPPSEEEWVAYARATWPDWQEHDIRSAWGSYKGKGWKGVVDWKACAKTCYHRQAGREGTARVRALVGAHPPAPRPKPAAPTESLPPPPPGGGVWPKVLEELRSLVDERDFDTWFRGTRQVGEPNCVLRIAVASELFGQYVPAEYAVAIEAALRACGVTVPVEYVTEEAGVMA